MPCPRRGENLKELGLIEDGAVLCVGGKIVSVGSTKDALRDPWIKKQRTKNHSRKLLEIDCAGKVVLPGFVDSHTHPAFMEPRLVDFERRISGATYEEIAKAGGGIRSSVASVRKSAKKELAQNILKSFQAMAGHGTTTVEAKSGYGLSFDSEMKSLEAIQQASKLWPGTVARTFLGAHAVPEEFAGRSQKYLELICDEMLPQVARRKLAQFVDIFCDRGAFTLEEAKTIFAAARKLNLATRAHVCQLTAMELAPLLEFEPASLDHLDHIRDHDISLLAAHNTLATLVPGANYFLNLAYPPARKLIDAGVAVALATDFNPGSSPSLSMPMTLSLACTHMQMSPAESIAAGTMNGAYALKLESRKGSIETGKDADLAIFEAKDYREIPYWFGSNRCFAAIMNGSVVSNRSQLAGQEIRL
jgi:imidazolonepropionase